MLKTLKNTAFLFENYSVTFIVTLLFYMNCGFYISFSLTGSALSAICPQYVFFYVAFVYTLFLLIKDKTVKISLPMAIGILVVLYIFITQFFVCGGRPIAILGSVVSISFYLLGGVLLPKLGYNQVKFITICAIIYNLILFSIDTMYKLVHCGFNIIYMFFYYRVKSSLLYPDANAAGVQITFFTVLTYYMYKREREFWYIPVIIAYIFLAFCTFSRAAVIALILMFVFDVFLGSIKAIFEKVKQKISYYVVPVKKIISYSVLCGTIFGAVFIILFIIVYLLSDQSFATKLALSNDALNFLSSANGQDLLFGIGFNNGRIGEFSNSEYAHAYLTTYVCETGILGFTIITSFLISIFLRCKTTIYVFIPFLIFAFAYLGHTHLHVFYSVLALIEYSETYKPQQKLKQLKG